jgi:hypothetical protein
LGDHCQTGEVGVINAPETGDTLEAFFSLAKNATNSTSPLAPNTGAVGGILAIKGQSIVVTTATTPAFTIISTPSNTTTSSTPASTNNSPSTNTAEGQATMGTLNYPVLAVAIILLTICISGAIGFWLYRKKAKHVSETTQAQEEVQDHNMDGHKDSQMDVSSTIPLVEMSGVVYRAAELPANALHRHETGLRYTSSEESEEVHASSFI